MKKIALILIVVLNALSVTSHAQSMKAYFDSKTTKNKINDNMVAYTFQVDNITTEKQEQQLEEKFKSSNSVVNVKGKLMAEGKATYVVSVNKMKNRESMRDMLIAAGINTISVDGTDVETAKSVEYSDSLKEKQRRKK